MNTDITNTIAPTDAAMARITALKDASERLSDLTILVAVRDQARARFGADVHYLIHEIETEDNIDSMHFVACGPDFEPLDDFPVAEGFTPFQQPLPQNMLATEVYLDMAILDQIDLDTEVTAVEQQITTGHLSRTALDCFVVDRAYAIEIAQDHINQGWDLWDPAKQVEDLTVEECEKIGDWFETKWGGFGDRFYDDWHRSIDQALEDVLTETRRR